MAVKGSGTSPMKDNPDPPMVEQTHYDARSGAPKKAQTAFPVKWTMRDMNKESGVTAGLAPGETGPDASSPNPLDPETPAQRGKTLKRQPSPLKPSWGMRGGMGQTVDPDIAGKVLGEAILSGATKLPSVTSAQSGPGVVYTGRDPN